MAISRRHFLKTGALTIAAMPLAKPGGCTTPVTPISGRRAVVIGSGFGGSVAALRLAQAGVETVLLERGREWPVDGPDSFPTFFALDRRKTWMGYIDALTNVALTVPYAGLIERFPGDGVDAVCGAGVGGGSLVYGGVLLRPQRAVFEQVFPYLSYDDMIADFYPRVLERISGGPIPDDILRTAPFTAHREFMQSAAAAGLEVIRSDVGFDWNVIRRELQGELAPAASAGEYIYGCNSGAKSTLDKNYLRDAIASGFVEIRPLHQVTNLRQLDAGGYEVAGDMLSTDGDVESTFLLTADMVFLAAGSMNTTKLLLQAKSVGTLPGLNDEIGQGWGTNGDELMIRGGINASIGSIQGGPACILAHDAANPIKPVAFMQSPLNVPDLLHTQLQLGMCVPDVSGRLRWDARKLTIDWPATADARSHEARLLALNKMLAQSGGRSIDLSLLTGAAWHPLGGAVMQRACDEFGELYGQPNLFVVDGSSMPGSTAAVNPSLTIAANAERIMEHVIARLR